MLGLRWIYDGPRDPVAVERIATLSSGNAQPQAQSESNTPDDSVMVTNPVSGVAAGQFATVDGVDDTEISMVGGVVLRVHRRLEPGVALGPGITTVTAPCGRSVLLSAQG